MRVCSTRIHLYRPNPNTLLQRFRQPGSVSSYARRVTSRARRRYQSTDATQHWTKKGKAACDNARLNIIIDLQSKHDKSNYTAVHSNFSTYMAVFYPWMRSRR